MYWSHCYVVSVKLSCTEHDSLLQLVLLTTCQPINQLGLPNKLSTLMPRPSATSMSINTSSPVEQLEWEALKDVWCCSWWSSHCKSTCQTNDLHSHQVSTNPVTFLVLLPVRAYATVMHPDLFRSTKCLLQTGHADHASSVVDGQ